MLILCQVSYEDGLLWEPLFQLDIGNSLANVCYRLLKFGGTTWSMLHSGGLVQRFILEKQAQNVAVLEKSAAPNRNETLDRWLTVPNKLSYEDHLIQELLYME